MLLNLGLAGDVAVAHTNEPGPQPEHPLASNSPSLSAFSLPTLPCLDIFYNGTKQSDSSVPPAGTVSAAAINPVTSTSSEVESSQAAPSALAQPRVFHLHTNKTWTQNLVPVRLSRGPYLAQTTQASAEAPSATAAGVANAAAFAHLRRSTKIDIVFATVCSKVSGHIFPEECSGPG